MIPKVIHYCWFGGNPLPELAQKCIESWEKFCPDYEIKCWDETNFDVNCCDYVREAYEAKKWAFVSDYVRLYVLYEYGGIYMDADVEVICPLDEILQFEAVSGFENDTDIPTGLIASCKGMPMLGELLNEYEEEHFSKNDGSFDLTTNVTRITRTFLKYGLKQNNTLQTIQGFTFLPKDYLCPKDTETGVITVTKNTLTIHHFDGSWAEKTTRERNRLRWKFIRIFGTKLGDVLYLLPYSLYVIRYDGFKAFWEKAKKKLKRGSGG